MQFFKILNGESFKKEREGMTEGGNEGDGTKKRAKTKKGQRRGEGEEKRKREGKEKGQRDKEGEDKVEGRRNDNSIIGKEDKLYFLVSPAEVRWMHFKEFEL